MATVEIIDGRKVTLPGVYSSIKSGIKNPPLALPFGNIIVIDTGSGAGYGGGSGINGENAEGIDAVYPIDNNDDFRLLTKGGIWYTLTDPLFTPNQSAGANGVSLVYYVRAATTVGATMTFTPVGGGANGGTLVLKCKDEGLIGNGSLTLTELKKGYAFILTAGVVDTAKFILKFYLGTYTGTASDGYPYSNIIESEADAKLVVQSPEFDDMADLNAWANSDSTVAEYFTVTTSTEAGDGSVDATDLVTYAALTVASGGTETFGTQDLLDVLEAIKPLRYTYILSDKFGSDSQDAVNDQYLTHLLDSDTSWEKFLMIGGAAGKADFATNSVAAAVHFNSDKVAIAHASPIIDSPITATKLRTWDSLYMAAWTLGRMLGLAPQIPGTFKILPMKGISHEMTTKEKTQALQAGVLVVHWDTQLATPNYCILQSVNTLQDNLNMVNPNGKSREISIRRISSQLNLDLTINAREDFFNTEDGANVFTVSDQYAIDWLTGQLTDKIAVVGEDNLIIEFRNVTAVTVSDAKYLTYEFKPNSPVNKFIMTGFMVS